MRLVSSSPTTFDPKREHTVVLTEGDLARIYRLSCKAEGSTGGDEFPRNPHPTHPPRMHMYIERLFPHVAQAIGGVDHNIKEEHWA